MGLGLFLFAQSQIKKMVAEMAERLTQTFSFYLS
jgi:hypothetical protein